ncbi:MAG: prolipoprotein diacylglyceryl transferase, partial [Anabaena sp. WA113]
YIPPDRRPLDLVNFEYFHPTFLYESLWNLMVFALLLTLFFRALSKKPRLKVGTLFLVYWVSYSLGRVWIEGLRKEGLMFGPLRIAQMVSLGGMTLGLFGLVWLYVFNRSLPDVVTPLKGEKNAPE